MIGGSSPHAAQGGLRTADATGGWRRLRARLHRDRWGAVPDDSGSIHTVTPGPRADRTSDEPPALSSLAQLAALEHLRGQPEDLELGRLLRDVVWEVPRLLVELTSCDVRVRAHDEDLRTVVRNLLMNVRDHATGHAVVSSCRTEDGRVLVTIADAGPGLRPMQVATLFQRGARGPGSPGLGLGLHVARMLCRRQGGDLRLLRSAPGCTFEIVLRAAESREG